MDVSSEVVQAVCAQLRQIAERIRQAEALVARMRQAGLPTTDLELQIGQLKAQYERFKAAFPECQ